MMPRKKTHSDFLSEVYSIVGNEYTVLSDYRGYFKHIAMKHEKCGRVYSVTPASFLSGGRRCKVCGLWSQHSSKRMTNKEFFDRVESLVGNEYEFMEDYVNARTKLRVLHNKCGNEYLVTPNRFFAGTRCPICKSSKGEREVERMLDVLGVLYEVEKEFDELGKKRFDFYLPLYDACIEYDGKQHFEEIAHFGGRYNLERQQRSDNIKNVYCMLNDIPLLCIPYWDYDRIPELVTQFLNELQTKGDDLNE